jgi:hypothetical protein
MKFNTWIKLLTLMFSIFPGAVSAQTVDNTSFIFKDLTLFSNPDKSWSVVSDVVINPAIQATFKKTDGDGIILGDVLKKESRLSTQASFGDVEVEFDFLLAKGTSAALLLEGRYRLNLSDSWTETTTSTSTMGGIAPRAEQTSGFSGETPFVNVAKAPGLWQHARVRFRAPQFNNNKKVTDAFFEEVYINGCLVQQSVKLQGPTAGALSADEVNAGPVVFVGSNGTLALKNVQVRKLPPAVAQARPVGRRFNRVVNPITLAPEGDNYLLRGFLMFGNKKKTHVISVGNPKGVNFSYDMKQGALLQAWNGPFLDVTEMWNERGEPQLAKPLGSVVLLSENPAVAKLADANAAWPDSVAFDNFKNMGYTLDKQRNPSFEYETGGYHVWDKIFPGNEGRSLVREISVTNAPANTYCRIANATAINALGKGLYVVGDKSYYIQIDEKVKPTIRTTAKGTELIVPVTANKLSYSIIW